MDFSSSQGRNISRSFPDTSNRGDTTISPTTFDIDLTQPLSYAKMVTLKQSRNNLKISQLKDQSVTQSVLLRASKAYYTVLKNYFLLDVSKKMRKILLKN